MLFSQLIPFGLPTVLYIIIICTVATVFSMKQFLYDPHTQNTLLYIIRTVHITEMADGGELSAEHLELRLIQSKHDIENPPSLQSVGITAIKL